MRKLKKIKVEKLNIALISLIVTVPIAFCHELLWHLEETSNRNSNLHNGNSHQNMDHCSRLGNPQTRNSRNHNL